jgi:hypothetical protein
MKIYFQEKRRVYFFVGPSRGKGRVRRSQSLRDHKEKALPISMKVHFQEKLVRLFLCKGGSHNYVEPIFDFLTSMLL